MDEVVVVGYQTMRKTDVVGAVSSIKSKELNVTTPTVGQSLVGKVSGVQIAQVSGAPYQSTKYVYVVWPLLMRALTRYML